MNLFKSWKLFDLKLTKNYLLTIKPSFHLIMKAAFYSKLDAYLNELDTKRQAKYLITAETYEKIVQVLSTETKYDPQFNFWAKKRFTSLNINDQPVVYSAK